MLQPMIIATLVPPAGPETRQLREAVGAAERTEPIHSPINKATHESDPRLVGNHYSPLAVSTKDAWQSLVITNKYGMARGLLFGAAGNIAGRRAALHAHFRFGRGDMTITTLARAVSIAALAAASFAAHADYFFSGSGTSGFLAPPTGEPWSVNFTGANNWGSPGVGAGVTAYTRADAAFGFDISFEGATISQSTIDLGNASNCAGTTTGGTTFCTLGPLNIWVATLLDDHTIAFRAQDPTFFITLGQQYFVNVLFEGSAPRSFTGRWLTEFSPRAVPEPSVLALLGLAMLGMACTRRKAA